MNEWTVGAQVPAGELRVWLDDLLDDRAAPLGWVHVTTAHAAIALIDRGDVVELSLDHDLGDDDVAGKGLHVVDHIAEQQVVAARDLWPRTASRSTAQTPLAATRWRAIERYACELHVVKRTLSATGRPRFTFGSLRRWDELPATGLPQYESTRVARKVVVSRVFPALGRGGSCVYRARLIAGWWSTATRRRG